MASATFRLRERPWDWLVAALFLAFGLSGLWLVHDSTLWNEWTAGERGGALGLGKVSRVAGGVRYRPEGSHLWRDIDFAQQSVSEGDAIFTAEDGKASLDLGGKANAAILPNSLVVIQAERERLAGALPMKPSISLQVEKGSLRLELPAKPRPVSLRAGGKRYRIDAAPDAPRTALHVSAGEGEVQLTTETAGAVRLSREGMSGAVSLIPGAGAVIRSETGLQAVRLSPHRMIAPVDGANLQGREVTFQWSREPTSRPAGTLRIELAGEVRRSVPVDDAKHAVSIFLEGGIYRWRLVEAGPAGEEVSQWRSLSVKAPVVAPTSVVVAPTPVQIVPVPSATPAVEHKIETLPSLEVAPAVGDTKLRRAGELDRVFVKLQWKGVPDAIEYRLKVLDPQGRVFKEASAAETQLNLVIQALGKKPYQYQVTALLRSGAQLVSGFMPIRIVLLPPVLRMPAAGSIHPRGKPVLLTWEKTALTESYQVEVWSSAAVSREGTTAIRNFFQFIPAKPGAYSWRVRGLSTAGETSWSDVRSFHVR